MTDHSRHFIRNTPLYNSRGGTSFEDQKFLTLEIKTVDTDSGFTMEEFLKHLTTLLSRACLENVEIQQAYEEHMTNSRIRRVRR